MDLGPIMQERIRLPDISSYRPVHNTYSVIIIKYPQIPEMDNKFTFKNERVFKGFKGFLCEKLVVFGYELG